MKNLLFIISLLLVVYSCKEDPVTPAGSQTQWYYYPQIDDVYHITAKAKILRINISTGEKQVIIDSALNNCQPQNGKIIFQKLFDRESSDSGLVTDYRIYMADADGSNQVQIRSWNTDGWLYFAPGGKTAVLKRPEQLFLLDLVNGKYDEEIKSLDEDINDFSYSTDGKKMAYIKSREQLFIYDINTASSDLIYNGGDTAKIVSNTMCWNDKHTELIFQIKVDSTDYLVAYNLQQMSLRSIFKGHRVYYPQVFANGEKILWLETKADTYDGEIWQCNIDGSGIEEIKANNGKKYYYVSVDPFIADDEILVYCIYDSSRTELAKMNINTGDVSIITDNIYFEE